MNPFARLTVSGLLLVQWVHAQALTLDAAAPGTLQATAGTQIQTIATPGGPLPMGTPVLQATAIAGGDAATCTLQWEVGGTSGVDFVAVASCQVAGNGSATISPGDFLLTLSAPTTGTVTLELSQSTSAGAALGPVQLRVDLDDDGIDELTEATPPQPHVRTLGPTPLRIRVRLQAFANQPGAAQYTVGVAVKPGPHTTVQPVSTGCTPVPFLVNASPFGDSLLFSSPCLGNCPPRLVVLGLSLQPQILPSLNSWCGLLLPSPDAVLFAGTNPSTYSIPLPPAARPIEVFAQAVWVFPNTLITTDSFRIAAF